MQPAYPLGGVAPRVEQLIDRVFVTERTPQPTKIMIIVRQQVGPPKIVELNAMLERPQESIGQCEAFAVLTANVAVVDQAFERWQRGPRP